MEGEKTMEKAERRVIAIDQGFSFCKVMVEGKVFKFPTAIAPVKASSVPGDREEGLYYLGNDSREFRVGEGALKFDRKYERDISFIMKYSDLMVAHALKLAELETTPPERLVVGLPLADYHDNKDALITKLSKFMVNGEFLKFDVRVVPQGVGALADYVTTCNPPRDEDGFVFDVGFNTVISVRYHSLAVQREGSQQYPQFGISRPLEEVLNILKAKHHYENLDLIGLNTAFLNGAIRGDVGGTIDIKSMAAPIMEEYLDDLLGCLRNDFGRYFSQSRRLILSGGGAYYLKDIIPERYAEKVVIPIEPEYANVRGYYQSGR